MLGEAAPPPPPPPPEPFQAPIIVIHTQNDYEHAHHAAVHHANVARGMSWIVWLIIVLVVSLGGAGAGISRCTHHNSLMSGLVWDGKEPLHCSGNDNVAVSGVEATFTGGAAIIATGNCHFRCTDCKISSQTAIEASGNAQVTMINGSVKGTNLLAEASGNARVTISGNVTVSGRVKESANGKVSAPTPPPEPPPTDTPPAAKTAPPVATPTPKAARPSTTTKPKSSK
jgi:hypothetical protein